MVAVAVPAAAIVWTLNVVVAPRVDALALVPRAVVYGLCFGAACLVGRARARACIRKARREATDRFDALVGAVEEGLDSMRDALDRPLNRESSPTFTELLVEYFGETKRARGK